MVISSRKFAFLLAISFYFTLLSGVFAQVDPTLLPTHGIITLSAGFSPDPTVIEVTAGGSEDTNSSGNCSARYLSSMPNVRVIYEAGEYPLRFFIDDPVSDTTLAIHAPDGSWYCVDDSAGLQPIIDFQNPLSGQYNVFVGNFFSDQLPTVSLQITERIREFGPDIRMGGIDFMGDPSNGTVVLESGFRPTPHSSAVIAGGPVDSSVLIDANNRPCDAGQIPANPTIRLQFVAENRPLRFFVNGLHTDTTLAINAPDGRWYCNDDVIELHPIIDFIAPLSGQYDVFVGTFSENEHNLPNAILFITEM